jgi:hypothetical protein
MVKGKVFFAFNHLEFQNVKYCVVKRGIFFNKKSGCRKATTLNLLIF